MRVLPFECEAAIKCFLFNKTSYTAKSCKITNDLPKHDEMEIIKTQCKKGASPSTADNTTVAAPDDIKALETPKKNG